MTRLQPSRLYACKVLIAAVIVATPVMAQDNTQSLLDKAITRANDTKLGNERIVGGEKTTIALNPWQVALVWAQSTNNVKAQFCGGSIISPEWVVTAAHCIDQRKGPEVIEILSGTDSLASGGVRSKVSFYRVHESYRSEGQGDEKRPEYDIALIKIDPNSNKLAGTAIAGIAAAEEGALSTARVSVTGWGVTERRYQATILLQYVEIPYVDNGICNMKRSYDGEVTDRMLCAGEPKGGKDTCRGDSGGPATTQIGAVRRLVGIASWGVGCGEPDMYGVYTRVSYFREWIAKQTAGVVAW